jgi:regulatory protein
MLNSKKLNKEVLKKTASFCAYQERTHNEVRQRLKEWAVWGDDAEEIIAWLISENYINEERFAKIFAGSKFRVKKWGRKKILFELKARGLSSYCIKMGMAEIDNDDYENTLKELLIKKSKELAGKNPLMINQKIATYAMSKGYETDAIWQAIRTLNEK